MHECRKARRYEVYLPLQVCPAGSRPAQFHTGYLRDISRAGVFFHSNTPIAPGTKMELTFALPTDKDRSASVLVRASAKALRLASVENEPSPLYGIAASIDRIDFVRPAITPAAA
jgi:PilZ domain